MVDNISSYPSNKPRFSQYNPSIINPTIPTSSSPSDYSYYLHRHNPTATNQHHEDEDHRHGMMIKEQDRLLPIANVGRIMKQILPNNAKISKEAKETMQECVTEFISFVTGEASDKCHQEKRKTVNGDDVCWAFSSLGFDDYVGPLKNYLHRYRAAEMERLTHNQNKDRDCHQ